MSSNNKKLNAGARLYKFFVLLFIAIQVASLVFMWYKGYTDSWKAIIYSLVYIFLSFLCMGELEVSLWGTVHLIFMIFKILLSAQMFNATKEIILSVAVMTAYNVIVKTMLNLTIKIFGLNPRDPMFIYE